MPGGAHGIKNIEFKKKQKLKMLNKRISNFEKKINCIYFYYISPCTGYPWAPSTNFSQFGPTVWPPMADINKYIWAKSFNIKIEK